MPHGLTEKQFAAMFDEQHGKCAYCKCKMVIPKSPRDKPLNAATVDHVLPKSRGGTEALANKKLACSECNCGKADGPMPVLRNT